MSASDKSERAAHVAIAGRSLARSRFIRAMAIAAALSTVEASAHRQDAQHAGVIDLANVIDPKTESALNSFLVEIEVATTVQMTVLTIDSTGEQHIGTFATDLASRWQLGDQDEAKGFLVVLAVRDCDYAIVPGADIEYKITTETLHAIAQQHFVDNFRIGVFSIAIRNGTIALANEISAIYGHALPPHWTMRIRNREPQHSAPALQVLMLGILVISGMSIFARRRARSTKQR